MITEYFFDDKGSLFDALHKDCAEQLKQILDATNRAALLVSGGSSPSPLYQRLSEEDLAWSQVDVALVDERWVDETDSGSNTTLIKQTLLQSKAAVANFVAMKNTAATPAQGLLECEENYQQLAQPFAITILGMGPDGHTASLFPCAKGLESALDQNSHSLCSAITANQSAVTGSLTERMTLSLYGLMQSSRIYLLITGQEKLDVYRRALVSSEVELTPVTAVLQQQKVPVAVYWAP